MLVLRAYKSKANFKNIATGTFHTLFTCFDSYEGGFGRIFSTYVDKK